MISRESGTVISLCVFIDRLLFRLIIIIAAGLSMVLYGSDHNDFKT